jgi:hypothetical protein
MRDCFMFETRYILSKKVWKDAWKMLRTQRAMIMKTSKEFHLLYPSAPTSRLPMKEDGTPLDAHGCSMMRWRLDNQDGFADSPYKQCGGSKTLMWSIDSVWTWILLEEEFMAYRFCWSQKWNVSVRYPFHS